MNRFARKNRPKIMKFPRKSCNPWHLPLTKVTIESSDFLFPDLFRAKEKRWNEVQVHVFNFSPKLLLYSAASVVCRKESYNKVIWFKSLKEHSRYRVLLYASNPRSAPPPPTPPEFNLASGVYLYGFLSF